MDVTDVTWRTSSYTGSGGAADAAGYVTVGSGEYTAVLTREQAEDERVLLALEHEGTASPRRAGFPRLAGPSEWDCFLSVKSRFLAQYGITKDELISRRGASP
jgi:hypothetical protein